MLNRTALGPDPFALWSLPLGLAFDHTDSARPLAMTHRTFTIWILCLTLFSRPKAARNQSARGYHVANRQN
jgi:hypothetical protein